MYQFMYTFCGNGTKFLFIFTGNSGLKVLDSGKKYVANVLLRQLASNPSFMNYGGVIDEVFLVVRTLYSKKREKPKAICSVILLKYSFTNSILHFTIVKGHPGGQLTIAPKIL